MADETKIIHDNTDGSAPSPASVPLGDTTAPKTSVGDSGSALDALMAAATKPAETNTDETPEEGAPTEPTAEEKAEEKAAEEKRLADEKAAADKTAADKAANAAKPDTDPTKTKETPPAAEEPKDKFSEVQLPPHSKPASRAAFDQIKKLAREEAANLRKEVETLKSKIPADGGLLPEVKKELDELRNFRKVHEGQNHADFKKTYEEPISTNEATILSKLKAAGFDEARIAKVKEIGVDKLDWDAVLPTLPTVTRRAIEAKLLENENLADKRAKALEEIQKAPQVFTEKQKQETEAAKKAEEAAVVSAVDAVVSKFDFAQQKTIPAGATAAEKADIEIHNRWAKEQADRRAILLSDNSPEMRGQTVAATLLAYQFKRDADSYKAKFEAVNAELDKIKKASSTQRRQSAAPATSVPVRNTGIIKDGRSALDELAAEAARGKE